MIVRLFAVFLLACCTLTLVADDSLRLATFNVDATPPIGSPVAYAPTRKVLDPLSARGVILLARDQKPIVLCAVDWIGIANGGMDAWREKLAAAAGTTTERVAVHTLHQHDGPRCDFTSEAILAQRGLAGKKYDIVFCRRIIERTAEAIHQSLEESRPITHIGMGKAKVEKVASNRRILGPDGKVKIIRWSKSTIPAAIAAPEGVIDPWLRSLSFYNGDKVLAVLTYYATHPQSYYGQGDVTSEFVGIARSMREKQVPSLHVHFNGASGNVAAGKYNDGSREMRPVLARRMAEGMRHAWENTRRVPVSAGDVSWRSMEVMLPLGTHLVADKLLKVLDDPKSDIKDKLTAAKHLAWLQRNKSGVPVTVSCLQIGEAYIVHMPGELFVEYQLAAQQMRPDKFVCMAAYGEYGPGYIGTKAAYSQGGYETSERASRVSPDVEAALINALHDMLGNKKATEANKGF